MTQGGGYKTEWGDWKLLAIANSSVKNCITFKVYENKSGKLEILCLYEDIVGNLITPYDLIDKYKPFLGKYNFPKYLLKRIEIEAVVDAI